MASESSEKKSAEKLRYIYRLQQSKLVSIGHLTENLSDIRVNMETFSTEQRKHWPLSWRVVPTGAG